ncbi:MAG: hypothetical protein JJT77_13775 [Crocinitomicaceae bacterium]|nr:hypothetical protein [Crocinitomicaceae bacterium]
MNTRLITIIAISSSFLAIVFFAVRNYQLVNHLEQYHKLVIGDQYFIEGDVDSAFYWYDQLNQDLLIDEFYTYRKLGADNQSSLPLVGYGLTNKIKGILEQCSGIKVELNDSLSNEDLLSELSLCLSDLKRKKMTMRESLSSSIDTNLLGQTSEGFLSFKDNNGVQVYYFGEKQDSMAHGFGKGIWSNENIYEGEWKNNLRHGKGVFRTKYGDFYDGAYYEGRRNGFGTYYFRNGDYYTGEWKDGKRSGFGTVLSAAGDTLVHGFWENDKFDRRRTRQEGLR